jgi:hypothetical protein
MVAYARPSGRVISAIARPSWSRSGGRVAPRGAVRSHGRAFTTQAYRRCWTAPKNEKNGPPGEGFSSSSTSSGTPRDIAGLLAGSVRTGDLQAGPRPWRQPRLGCLLASGRLLLYAYSGSADVHAVATAFVLAATRASVSAGSIGRTDSSAMGGVRACGEYEVGRRSRGSDLLFWSRETFQSRPGQRRTVRAEPR